MAARQGEMAVYAGPFMVRPRGLPSVPVIAQEPLPEGDLNIVAYQAEYRNQLARAKRAVRRFTFFDNQPATAESMGGLLDAFLDAVVVLHHCRDWFQSALEDEGLDSDLHDLLASPTQEVVADLANASKHVRLDRRKSEGDIFLARGEAGADESLAEFYCRLVLKTPQGDEHPTAFLRRALAECDTAATKAISMPLLLKKLGSSPNAA